MEKTFNAAEAEARISRMWQDTGAFRAGANAKPGAPHFSIMIPPPNVTGALHVGHAFNNTLQDILVRWHRMRGDDTLWQPGQDHAGIATQLQVEKKLAAESNLRRTDLTREDFVAKVWEWKRQYGNTIIEQLKRLGASCDWDRNAFTMSGAPGAPKGEEGNFHDAVLKVFVDLYNKGLIYRGKRLVNWDPHFETAISDLEVENIETDGHMWHFKYPLAGGETYEYVEKDADGKVTFRETRDYISIATTRPETMLGDGAVAVHPKDERYAPIVGKLCEIPVGPKEHRRLIPIITDEYPDPSFGSGAVKITGAHDFNDYAVAQRNGIPKYRLMDTKGAMRADGAAYAEAAAMATAVARGAQSLTEAEVDAINLVPDDLRGLDRFEARKKVVAQITADGLAVMTTPDDPRLGKSKSAPAEDAPSLVPLVEAKKIMQPYGDRSKVVIEPMLTDQWFVDAKTLAQPALEAVRDGRTEILPEKDKRVYFHWLENIEPWCISRQLWWGHRVPVWTAMVPDLNGKAGTHRISVGGNIPLDREFKFRKENAYDEAAMGGTLTKGGLLTMEFCAASLDEAKKLISEVWTERAGHAPHNLIEVDSEPQMWPLDDSGKNHGPFVPMWRDPDVLDTWFSSGLWPIGTLGWPEQTEELKRYFPTSVLVTGFDILFFWVARMMMMQLEVVKEVPFKTVYLHSLVRDEKGVKMSKTLGNVIDPLELIDEFGADAVRFTMAAMAVLGGSLKLSKERVTGYRNFTTKLWNATRFAELNGAFVQTNVQTPVQTPVQTRGHMPGQVPAETLNKWIIGETAKVRVAVDEALEAFRFNDAANALYAFVWGKVCDWYVEFSKPLLVDGTPGQQAETRATMAWVLDQCVILLHPFMPFITEELWGLMASRAKPCVHADWPTYGLELIDQSADREMNWVINLIEQIRSARAEMHVPAGLHLKMLVTSLDSSGKSAWDRNETLIKRLARIESLDPAETAPKGSITIAVEGGTFALPLAGIIDVEAEKSRLSKTLEKLDKDLAGLNGRLKNPKFVESAPEEVVEETRDLAAAKTAEAEKLKAALKRLAEIG